MLNENYGFSMYDILFFIYLSTIMLFKKHFYCSKHEATALKIKPIIVNHYKG